MHYIYKPTFTIKLVVLKSVAGTQPSSKEVELESILHYSDSDNPEEVRNEIQELVKLTSEAAKDSVNVKFSYDDDVYYSENDLHPWTMAHYEFNVGEAQLNEV